ncbi:MAG: carbohydrate kinase family protein [Ginsengibacter sp.]
MIHKKLFVVGELNIDVKLNNINGFPILEEEILADNLTITMGSSSAIFASNIASIGINTSFCGMVGNDSFGSFILDELKKKQVNTTYIIESVEYKTISRGICIY